MGSCRDVSFCRVFTKLLMPSGEKTGVSSYIIFISLWKLFKNFVVSFLIENWLHSRRLTAAIQVCAAHRELSYLVKVLFIVTSCDWP